MMEVEKDGVGRVFWKLFRMFFFYVIGEDIKIGRLYGNCNNDEILMLFLSWVYLFFSEF